MPLSSKTNVTTSSYEGLIFDKRTREAFNQSRSVNTSPDKDFFARKDLDEDIEEAI